MAKLDICKPVTPLCVKSSMDKLTLLILTYDWGNVVL